jgi:hypothetical protein
VDEDGIRQKPHRHAGQFNSVVVRLLVIPQHANFLHLLTSQLRGQDLTLSQQAHRRRTQYCAVKPQAAIGTSSGRPPQNIIATNAVVRTLEIRVAKLNRGPMNSLSKSSCVSFHCVNHLRRLTFDQLTLIKVNNMGVATSTSTVSVKYEPTTAYHLLIHSQT